MKEITIDAGYKPQVGDVTQHGWACTESYQTCSVFNDKHGNDYFIHHTELWMWHGLTVTREVNEVVSGKKLFTIEIEGNDFLYSINGNRSLIIYNEIVRLGVKNGDKLHVIKAEGE